MKKVAVLGSKGRMGQYVLRLLETEFSNSARLAVAADRGDDLAPLLDSDVIVDFSSPQAVVSLCDLAQERKGVLPALVVGSTGWSDADKKHLELLARRTTVLVSSNFSTGIAILLEILRTGAPILRKFGYTPVVVETHHRHKKDAPSGTAITIQKTIEETYRNSIQTHSIRAGEIIGDHEVTFYGSADHLSFGHFAQDRSILARGAIEVALWLSGRHSANQNSGRVLEMRDFIMEKFNDRS